MKILVVGAGAVGGYFGGRLFEKGEDVTFLIREKRKEQLKKHGLQLQSTKGNYKAKPQLLLSSEKGEIFDLIMISTKAYHLDKAIADMRPYVGGKTIVLPLLNGMAHLEKLDQAFGADCVIGGLCFIESTLDPKGGIVHSSPMGELVYGARSEGQVNKMAKLDQTFSGTKAEFRRSDNIDQEMWHKYLFITAMSGITSLMRAPLGPIREVSPAREILKRLIAEGADTMRSVKAPIAEQIEDILIEKIDQVGYDMKSSMQRDIEKGGRIEADHLQGYLLQIAEQGNADTPVLRTIYGSLKVYEELLKGKIEV